MGVGSLNRFIIASAVLHALIVIGGVSFYSFQPAKKVTPDPLWITLNPPEKNLKKPQDQRKQIVRTQKGIPTEQAPENAYFGERNQVVEKESASDSSRPEQSKKIASAKRNPPSTKRATPTLSQLGVAITKPSIKDLQNEIQSKPSDRGASEWMAGNDSQVPQEYIQGLKPSEVTALNTREHVFYGYFQRIRDRLDLAWEGTLRHQLTKLYRSGRALASEREHITRVLVTLNPLGEITRVEIVEQSGTRDLDDAAVKAFNQAGPFPNPPKGILDRNNRIQLRWDFVLRS